jgi:hypothetical protein
MGTQQDLVAACGTLGGVYVHVLITGGRDENTDPLTSVKDYLPASNTWTAVVAMPGFAFSMLYMPL